MRHVYLGGPITGLTYDGACAWRESFVVVGWRCLSPMRDKESFRMPGPLPSTFDDDSAAVRRDLHDIRRADAVVVNLLDAAHVSIGSMCELGYARALDKYIIVVRTGRSCPHDHLFVSELASITVPSLAEARRLLEVL